MCNQTEEPTKSQPCLCIYISLAHWNSKNDHCCTLEGTLIVKISLHLPFLIFPTLRLLCNRKKKRKQRRYEDTPVSTSSSSQAAVKMCCWHIPIMRNYESYSEKNIFFPECCSGEKKATTNWTFSGEIFF